MKRYQILVTNKSGAETEICQIDSNPERVVDYLKRTGDYLDARYIEQDRFDDPPPKRVGAVNDSKNLHPLVEQQIAEGNRDKPLTMNWKPADPSAFDFLGLPKLSAVQRRAARQIVSE